MADWPYNTKAWRDLRRVKLMDSPTCEPCGMRGKLVPADTVDHVRSIASGGPAFPALDGLMSMCAACHNSKTAAVDRPGGKGVALKGCGVDGMPIDPSHPFWGGEQPAAPHTPSRDGRREDKDRGWGRFPTKFDRGRSWG